MSNLPKNFLVRALTSYEPLEGTFMNEMQRMQTAALQAVASSGDRAKDLCSGIVNCLNNILAPFMERFNGSMALINRHCSNPHTEHAAFPVGQMPSEFRCFRLNIDDPQGHLSAIQDAYRLAGEIETAIITGAPFLKFPDQVQIMAFITGASHIKLNDKLVVSNPDVVAYLDALARNAVNTVERLVSVAVHVLRDKSLIEVPGNVDFTYRPGEIYLATGPAHHYERPLTVGELFGKYKASAAAAVATSLVETAGMCTAPDDDM
jgi:hypothetical protein